MKYSLITEHERKLNIIRVMRKCLQSSFGLSVLFSLQFHLIMDDMANEMQQIFLNHEHRSSSQNSWVLYDNFFLLDPTSGEYYSNIGPTVSVLSSCFQIYNFFCWKFISIHFGHFKIHVSPSHQASNFNHLCVAVIPQWTSLYTLFNTYFLNFSSGTTKLTLHTIPFSIVMSYHFIRPFSFRTIIPCVPFYS